MHRLLLIMSILGVLFGPIALFAADCTWNVANPTVLSGQCDVNGMAEFAMRPGDTHTVKITDRGRYDGRYTVYESDGCSDKNHYTFCDGNGWAMTATPIDLGGGRIGLLTAGHFNRNPSLDMIPKDVAIFLPEFYDLDGAITSLTPLAVADTTPSGYAIKMSVDIRNGSQNIPLDITLHPMLVKLGSIKFLSAPAPKKMGRWLGGESGTSLLAEGRVQAIFTGRISGPQRFDYITMVPGSTIHRLMKQAAKTKGVAYVQMQ